MPKAASVGSHHRRFANAKTRMHDFVLGTRSDHARLMRLGAFAEAHEHRDHGAELAAVELDSFLAAAVEKQIGLDQHGISFS
jgi:hypothetical protein